eukprot:gene3813-4766_t
MSSCFESCKDWGEEQQIPGLERNRHLLRVCFSDDKPDAVHRNTGAPKPFKSAEVASTCPAEELEESQQPVVATLAAESNEAMQGSTEKTHRTMQGSTEKTRCTMAASAPAGRCGSGQAARALAVPSGAEPLKGGHFDAGRVRGNAAFKSGDFGEAVEWYTRGITDHPQDFRLFTNRATSLLKDLFEEHPGIAVLDDQDLFEEHPGITVLDDLIIPAVPSSSEAQEPMPCAPSGGFSWRVAAVRRPWTLGIAEELATTQSTNSLSGRTLLVAPLEGLARRLEVVVNALLLAADMGRQLLLCWQPTVECMRRYADGAEAYREYEDVDCLVISTSEEFYPGGGVASQGTHRRWLGACGDPGHPHRVAASQALNSLKPRLAVTRRVMRLKPFTVAVHIRGGDNINGWHSPIEIFFAAMEARINREPRTRFFLCTDDPEMEELVYSRYGVGLVSSYPKRSLDRHSKIGVEDALVDLLHLGQSEELIGSYWSSYTSIGALWRMQPMKVIYRQLDTSNKKLVAEALEARFNANLKCPR